MKLQTSRFVARLPGEVGRPVAAMPASFAERTQQARIQNRVAPSKALTERTVP